MGTPSTGGTTGGGSFGGGNLAAFNTGDVSFGGGGGGGGVDTASFGQFQDPASVVGDPFFDPMFGSQNLGGGGGMFDPATGSQQAGAIPPDVGGAQSGDQQQPQQQRVSGQTATGGPPEQQRQPSSDLSRIARMIGGPQQQGPAWIQPAQQAAPPQIPFPFRQPAPQFPTQQAPQVPIPQPRPASFEERFTGAPAGAAGPPAPPPATFAERFTGDIPPTGVAGAEGTPQATPLSAEAPVTPAAQPEQQAAQGDQQAGGEPQTPQEQAGYGDQQPSGGQQQRKSPLASAASALQKLLQGNTAGAVADLRNMAQQTRPDTAPPELRPPMAEAAMGETPTLPTGATQATGPGAAPAGPGQAPPRPGEGPTGTEPGAVPGQAVPGAAPGTAAPAPGAAGGPPAAPDTAAAPEQAAATVAGAAAPGDAANQGLLNYLSGGRQPAVTPEGRAPAQGGVPQPTAQDNANFLTQRGGHSTRGYNLQQGPYGAYRLNPQMADRMAAAGREFERTHPGQRAQYGEGDRDPLTQSVYYRRYRTGRGGIAARPGHSLHQSGNAMDVPEGAFNNWLHAGNAARFGLGFPLGSRDPNHMQMMDNRGRAYPYHPAMEQRGNLAGMTQVAQAGGAPQAGGVAQPPPGGFQYTFYAPGAGGKEGKNTTSRPNREGQRVPHTLDDYVAGRSRYVSLASDPSRYGQSLTIPRISWRGQTLTNVPGYIHDTGGDFQGRPDRIDIAGGRGRAAKPHLNKASVGGGPQSALETSQRTASLGQRYRQPPTFDERFGGPYGAPYEPIRGRQPGDITPGYQERFGDPTKVISRGEEGAPYQVAGDVVPLPIQPGPAAGPPPDRELYEGASRPREFPRIGPAQDTPRWQQMMERRPIGPRGAENDLLDWIIRQAVG